MKENQFTLIRSEVDDAVTRALRGKASATEIQGMFDDSINELERLLKAYSLFDIVSEGMRWFKETKFQHVMEHVPEAFREKVIAEPSRLGEWLDRENLSLIFEGLRYADPTPSMIGDLMTGDTITDIYIQLFRHRWARYLKQLIGLDSKRLRYLRELSQYRIREKNKLLGARIRKEVTTTLVRHFWSRAQRLDQLLPLSNSTIDDLYFEVYEVKYSDVLKVGSVFLRLAALEASTGTNVWPRVPIEMDDVGPLLATFYESDPRFKSHHIDGNWIQKWTNGVVKHLALQREYVIKQNQSYTVYDHLRKKLDFSIIRFRYGSCDAVIIDPAFTGVNLFSHHSSLRHDETLEQAVQRKRTPRRKRQRWQRWWDTLERFDLEDWKINLLEKIDLFEWVKVGPFKINVEERKEEVDILALLNWKKKRFLLVGEGKRRRSPFFPIQQLQALSFIQEAHRQALSSCEFLKESEAARSYLERQVGESLQDVSRFLPFVVTPHIQFIEGILVFWAGDEPETAIQKVKAMFKEKRIS